MDRLKAMLDLKIITESLINFNEKIPLWMKFMLVFSLGGYCVWEGAKFHFNSVIVKLEEDNNKLEIDRNALLEDSKKLILSNSRDVVKDGVIKQREAKIVELQTQNGELRGQVEQLTTQVESLLVSNHNKERILGNKELVLKQIEELKAEKRKLNNSIVLFRSNPSEREVQEEKRNQLITQRIDEQIYQLQLKLTTL